MKNQELYQKSVDILAKAYVDNTLERANCCACAVGNLVAANCGIKMQKRRGLVMTIGESFEMVLMLGWMDVHPHWQDVFMTNGEGIQFFSSEKYDLDHIAKEQIDSTGYTMWELAKIEHAFERNYKGEDPMFSSLMAVIDVLDKIHEVDQAESKVSRDKFVLA